MCFSAESSLAAGVALIPAGAYCVATALRKKHFAYLAVAATPLLFGVQQLCEAGVWHGLEHHDPELVRTASLAFLFFAIAFWPGWVPFGTAVLEERRGKRRFFYILGAIGLTIGCLVYVPAAMHYGDWLEVGIKGHSIQYDFSGLPAWHSAAGVVWQGLYLVAVCVPLLTSRDRQLRVLGVSIILAAVVTHVTFRYAFTSVWCFFAALLSAHICYVLYRLPHRGELPVTPEPAPAI